MERLDALWQAERPAAPLWAPVFLGLGVQEPQTSLGKLVNDGTKQMEGASWMLLIPGTLLAAVLLCFNFLGDGMRDLFDSRRAR